jgi:hypothetical protein
MFGYVCAECRKKESTQRWHDKSRRQTKERGDLDALSGIRRKNKVFSDFVRTLDAKTKAKSPQSKTCRVCGAIAFYYLKGVFGCKKHPPTAKR